MGLSEYRRKRSFDQTPEPTGGKGGGAALRFVVQKHAASHLHYDVRLEMEGVLKSWAVPKGPSLNPGDKRLAMMVEDHPYDYKDFEGVIPPGNYGAGTVIIWDEGTYLPTGLEGTSRQQQEKELLGSLYRGTLKITLKGKKLKGAFVLTRTPARGDNAWLLMKLNDRFAADVDISAKDRSVRTGRRLQQVAQDADRVWISNRASNGQLKADTELPTEKTFWRAVAAGAQSAEAIEIQGTTLEVWGVDRQLWPGVAKAHVLTYYHEAAGYLLPFLKARPLRLRVHPQSAEAAGLELEDLRAIKSAGLAVKKPAATRNGVYAACETETALLYLVNLGLLELRVPVTQRTQPAIEVWQAAAQSAGEWKRVQKALRAFHAQLTAAGLAGFPVRTARYAVQVWLPVAAGARARLKRWVNHGCAEVTQGLIQQVEGNDLLVPMTLVAGEEPWIAVPVHWRQVNSAAKSFVYTPGGRLPRPADWFTGGQWKEAALHNTAVLGAG